MIAINNSTDAVAAVGAVLLGGLTVLAGMYGFRHFITYSSLDSRLDVRVFGTSVCKVLLSEIEQVEVIPFSALVPFTRSFRWDVFFSQKLCGYRSRVVAIKRRTGLIKRIIISPSDPDRFSDLLRAASPEASDRDL
ncbi:MAG: hypothetical protein ABSD72_14615 [Terracidiphilus sp.]